jgi:hypothetical protein
MSDLQKELDIMKNDAAIDARGLLGDRPEINVGELCFAWYPINKSVGGELDLFFCKPIRIGREYTTGELFFGREESKLRSKGVFKDICTADLQPI